MTDPNKRPSNGLPKHDAKRSIQHWLILIVGTAIAIGIGLLIS